MFKCDGLKGTNKNFPFSSVNTSQFTQCLKLDMLSPYDGIIHFVDGTHHDGILQFVFIPLDSSLLCYKENIKTI